MNLAVKHVSTVLIFYCGAAAVGLSAHAAAPKREKANIDWASAKNAMRSSDFRERTRDGGIAAKEAQKVRLPILLVDDGEVRIAPGFRQQTDSYTAHYALKGANLAIAGLARPLSLPQREFSTAPSTTAYAPYKFEPGDDGSDLSFERFGAFYNLRISCQLATDERCTKPEFLSNLADKLAVAGGEKL
jgi:hypothetical protein